jgi:hypothetical protein|tara:strand:+ start:2843 stop:3115 length:273 start_codon:yes stop_codon:yes gene_type:complete
MNTDKFPGRLIIDAPEGEVVLDGLDDAIIGDYENVLAYSVDKIVGILVKRDGMSVDEAIDYYDFNIGCLWAGDRTPIFIWENNYTDLGSP